MVAVCAHFSTAERKRQERDAVHAKKCNWRSVKKCRNWRRLEHKLEKCKKEMQAMRRRNGGRNAGEKMQYDVRKIFGEIN